jgi:hypothetical protein
MKQIAILTLSLIATTGCSKFHFLEVEKEAEIVESPPQKKTPRNVIFNQRGLMDNG